ncbi:MAG: hypothetical protein HOH04_14580 [Rhodospirillaceae bacterium]|jgi:hypothetical protein|nr:hypothetical protein [Rhodospirillaceae bacterium]
MAESNRKIERVQTGVRIEKRILKVLKALAARNEMGLGDLIEGIVLHSFEGRHPFEPETLEFIEQMRSAYGLDLTATDSHKLTEQ